LTDERFTSDGTGEKEDDGGKSQPLATFLSVLEGINTARKYLMKFDDDNMMAALSSTGNEMYGVEQKEKKQQLTLMDMWKN
jgi:hypothetical protein